MNAPAPNDPGSVPSQERLIKMRTFYYQAKTCNVLALIFVLCGVLVFASIYQTRIAPDMMAALRDVSTIGLIVAAFLPAILLSFLARKYEKKYLALSKEE